MNMLLSIYKSFAIALFFFTPPLSTSSAKGYISKLKTAISDNDVNTVHQLMLQDTTDWLTENRGWEIASLAAEKGNLPMIQYIAERELSTLAKKNAQNETIGHIAAEHGHPNITEYFLDKTVPRLWRHSESEIKSLFDLIAEKGYLNCLTGRVSSYHPDDLKRIGRIAAQNGHLDIACYMGLQMGEEHCVNFKGTIITAIKNSHKRDPRTLELFKKLADEWSTTYYGCPNIVELVSSANDTELLRYVAENTCTYFLKCREYLLNGYYPELMKIAFEKNFINQNFLDCLEKRNGTIHGYIGQSKYTICHLAAEHNRLDVIQILAERNASILERVDAYGRTIVDIAAWKGYKDIVRYAVRQKPSIRAVKTDEECTEENYYFYWYDYRYRSLTKRYQSSTSAFHLAIIKNWMDMDTLKYVVEKEGTDLITRTDHDDGKTVAHTAAMNANMEVLQYLVEKKPSVLSLSDFLGNTVLHILASKNKLNEKRLKFFVLMGAPLVVKNRNGDTVGHILAKYRHTDWIEYLAEEDPSILKIVDKMGDTVLHILTKRNAMSVKNLAFFVDKGASLLAYNNQTKNVPLIASKQGNLEIVRFVVEKETSVLEGNASIGVEIAEIAASQGHSNILKLIVDKKPILLADRPSILFKLPNVSQVLDTLQYLKTVCETKILKWDRRQFESKVLRQAFKNDYPDILRFMDYDVNMMNDRGEPLIFTAIRRNRSQIFHFLSENEKTNLTALDCEGNNILFIAAMTHDLEKLKYILEKLKPPLDIEWRNYNDDSLLNVAVNASSKQEPRDALNVMKYLIEQVHYDDRARKRRTKRAGYVERNFT